MYKFVENFSTRISVATLKPVASPNVSGFKNLTGLKRPNHHQHQLKNMSPQTCQVSKT